MSLRELAETTPFEGDYSGRDWLRMTPDEHEAAMIEAKAIGQERARQRANRPTLTHRQARALDLDGRAVAVYPRKKLVVVDGYKKYRLID